MQQMVGELRSVLDVLRDSHDFASHRLGLATAALQTGCDVTFARDAFDDEPQKLAGRADARAMRASLPRSGAAHMGRGRAAGALVEREFLAPKLAHACLELYREVAEASSRVTPAPARRV